MPALPCTLRLSAAGSILHKIAEALRRLTVLKRPGLHYTGHPGTRREFGVAVTFASCDNSL